MAVMESRQCRVWKHGWSFSVMEVLGGLEGAT